MPWNNASAIVVFAIQKWYEIGYCFFPVYIEYPIYAVVNKDKKVIIPKYIIRGFPKIR